jgi:hypothetical protein
MRWAGNVAGMGEIRVAYRVLVGNHEGKKLLGRPRRRCEDNIKMDLLEIGYGAWTVLVWFRIGAEACSFLRRDEFSGPLHCG